MADIIAVANQKGGIAKTTTTVHLAHYAAEELGLRVLLLDMDKQGSLSMSFPVEQGGLMASEIYVGATKAPGATARISRSCLLIAACSHSRARGRRKPRFSRATCVRWPQAMTSA